MLTPVSKKQRQGENKMTKLIENLHNKMMNRIEMVETTTNPAVYVRFFAGHLAYLVAIMVLLAVKNKLAL